MGGKEARDGFWFQDAKALTRLLDDALERRRCQLLGLELGPELRVGVESAVEVVVDPDADELSPKAPRPIWDGTFSVGDRVVVDECKLGGPTRDDRVTLYRRLRATVASGVSVRQLAPRLTAGRDGIGDPDRWRDLNAEVASATVPLEPPSRVESVESLASEALYYLTVPNPIWSLKKYDEDGKAKKDRVVPVTPALSIDDARSLVGRFELDADTTLVELEEQLKASLVAIGAGLVVDEMVDLLRGWVDRVARVRGWSDVLTATSLSDRLLLVARYLAIPASVEQLWHRLRETAPPKHATVMIEQPWREVQPNIEELIRDRTTMTRVAFTSEGGVGKSFLLGALYAEQTGLRVWVDAVAPLSDIEEALALGAWATQRTDDPLTVFIDAIDQLADPAALMGAVDRALVPCKRSVVYVGSRFATWADIRDRLPGWHTARLARWPTARIRELTQTGRTEPLSADLIELLRTPLLLDLFLRTFAVGEPVPMGVATRHGVLRAYFERRVYAGGTAAGRRAVLDAGVAAVLANAATWRDESPSAQQLISEGVVLSAFGELRFRHALLRDFSVALQLVPRDSEVIARTLRDVASPVVRNELLRGIMEAQLDPDPLLVGPSTEEIVRACTASGLAPGIALGTTDAPTPGLLVAIAQIEGGVVLRQALAHARLIDNRAWLRVPVAVGGARPKWFGEPQLHAMAHLAELAFATGDTVAAALASTLRTWTWEHHVEAENAWSIATIGSLLASAIPDDTTAGWYGSLKLGEIAFRSRFLEQLRELGTNPNVLASSLSSAVDKIVFAGNTHLLDGGQSLWEVTNLCLSENDGKPGLLSTRPPLGLSLLFRLSVERELAQERQRVRIHADPAVLAELLGRMPEPPSDFVEAEARLRVEPTLTEFEAFGDLVDDSHSIDRHASGYVETIIEESAQRASEDVAFAEALCDAALATRSVCARMLALSLRGSTHIDEVGIELLSDPRMYHFRGASVPIWDAIQSRWSTLPSDVRASVQRNILARARSPRLAFTDVGRLASAIPRDALDVALEPYLVFLETSGRSATPARQAYVEVSGSDLSDDDVDGEGITDAGWQRFETLASSEGKEGAVEEALTILRRDLPNLTSDVSDSVWFAISRVVGVDEKRKERALDAKLARILFEGAFGAIEARRKDVDSWATLLDIADACPSYVLDNEALAMRTRVIGEVVLGAGQHAEREEHAWRALVAVRPIAWFSNGTGGRAFFETWFRDDLHGDGLQASLPLLPFLQGEVRLDLVRHVLEADNRLTVAAERHAFVSEVGRLLAVWSIWWNEPFARDLVRDWCDAVTRPGALATAESWRWFLSGFAWGLQNEVRHVRADLRAEPGLGRFVALLEVAWSAWRTVIDDSADGTISVGWSVVAPLAAQFATRIPPPAGGWSASLSGLIGRVISDGGRNDLFAFQQVDWSAVDSQTLAVAADSAITRVRREAVSRMRNSHDREHRNRGIVNTETAAS